MQVRFTQGTTSTINSYGYSPHPLSSYLSWVETILTGTEDNKPIIVSITAPTPEEIFGMISSVQSLRTRLKDIARKGRPSRVAIEINTSCPNIPGASPSGYSFPTMAPLIQVLADAFNQDRTLTIGLKLPPYTFKEQYRQVLEVLESYAGASPHGASPISFLTCTNTLGSSLLFPDQASGETVGPFALPTALGGLAGDLLHPLALGNVHTFSTLIRGGEPQYPRLSGLKIIGVGGVTSKAAAKRMRDAGADVVGCATLYGKEGVKAFEILTV
ncbi:dihydroorotate oxidase [Coprinopsis cinerea okayama7|uniref:Dihydroorotate oxidase n=1 Tax=Coprinopsis cinerea (strain Okayama-7 / 130 / ATCC MYA-4618 / FGSC 9003) TaxID=240176 RepID=A8N278_COPC7|nr:dihydroorotate oxidase [Coprinopsis cinerea okayama7\|eukprot:XP_001828951.1 dihydroorotate oxidase [Coprinopsis cinerea okayama7\